MKNYYIRRELQITMARTQNCSEVPSNLKKRRRYYFLQYLEHFLCSFAAEPVRTAKSSLVAFERFLSSFAAKPIRNATPCLVAFEHILNGFAAKPIRIANLTLLPRDVCGYAHANMAPLPRNQCCHSQKPVLLLSWCSCSAECGSKSTLMSGGAGGCAQGPVHCRWVGLNLTCLLQNSTGNPAPFETFL